MRCSSEQVEQDPSLQQPIYNQLLSQNELVAQGLNNLANQLIKEDQIATAITLYRRAIVLAPYELRWKANLAGVLAAEGFVSEAELWVKEVLSVDPDYYFSWSTQGYIEQTYNNFTQAITCFDRAAELAPAHGTVQFDKAYGYLIDGQWGKGLELYEGRRNWRPERVFHLPRWDGSPDADVHVWGEQGLGDTINFARYIPWLAGRVRSVTFAVPLSLYTLLQGYSRYCNVVTLEYHQPQGVEVALMSLPFFAGTTPDTVPPDPGVLNVALSDGAFGGNEKKIGIVWAGNKDHTRNRSRNIPFASMLRLAEDPRLSLYSLQVGARAQDIAAHRAQSLVTDLSGTIEKDWCATAAVLKTLDAVVTADTSVAHLAGALGVPTALLVFVGGDWRWLHTRKDCVWYPSVRLFRQTKPNDWGAPLEEVAGWLSQL